MIKIGIICPSEIAFRRFLPALGGCKNYQYIGVAVANDTEWFGEKYEDVDVEKRQRILQSEFEKAKKFKEDFGGSIFNSYKELITSGNINAVYIPLPPTLHFKWAKEALEHGKNVFVEKPSTTNRTDTKVLISLAQKKQLALHENYMFAFHSQLEEIRGIIDSGILGDVRMYRLDFGFPKRAKTDFRYAKNLGGGALLDCGGYTLKYASMLLGGKINIEYAKLNHTDEFEVDLYGSAALSNDRGQVVQIAFGMDNEYKCELEVWGSKGRLVTGRVLTAPAGFVPTYSLIIAGKKEEHEFQADDTFKKSLEYFSKCTESEKVCLEAYENIQRQADLVDSFVKKSGM